MLRNLRKTAVAALVLGSATAFAGTMGPVCTPGMVSVPCERSAWSFAGQALYLQPTGDDLVFTTPTATGVNVQGFDHDWNWGFKLEGAYHFNTGNDLNVNWYHFDNDTTHTFAGITGVVAPTFVKITPKWDAVNVEFGQHVDFGEQSNIRFHGGLQWAQVERNLNSTVSGVVFGNANNKFDGVGPRVGADMSYDIGNGFGIYGNGAIAVLVGDNDVNISSNLLNITTLTASRTMLVPELEGKLGVNYTYPMAQGDFTIDAGYMWVDYLHALGDADFGMNGPFVGLKWVGNVV